MDATFGSSLKLIIAVSLLVIAVVAVNTFLKSFIDSWGSAGDSITPGVYALITTLIAIVVLILFNKSQSKDNVWTFIVVTAVVFLAAIAIASWIESFTRGWMQTSPTETPWVNELIYAIIVVVIVGALLNWFFVSSKKNMRYKAYDKIEDKVRTSIRNSPRLQAAINSPRGQQVSQRLAKTLEDIAASGDGYGARRMMVGGQSPRRF